MNHPTIVRAAAAACLLICATATAAEFDLTVYGRADLAVTHATSGSATHNGTEGVSLENNFSLLGARGSEALGEDWEFLYQVEFGVQAEDQDNGRTPLTSRPTFIGVDGPWGRLTAGFMDPVLKLTKGFVDVFDNYSTKHDRLVAGDKPHGDSFQYWSPALGGSLRLAGTVLLADEYYAPGDPRRDNGNWQAALTWGDRTLAESSLYLAAAVGRGVEDIDAVRGVAQVRLGAWRLGGMLQETKRVDPGAAGLADRDGFGWFASLMHTRGPWRLKAQGGTDDSGCGWIARRIYDTGDGLDGAVPKIANLTVGLEYWFTVRLRLHAEWGRYTVDGYEAWDDDVTSAGMRFEF